MNEIYLIKMLMKTEGFGPPFSIGSVPGKFVPRGEYRLTAGRVVHPMDSFSEGFKPMVRFFALKRCCRWCDSDRIVIAKVFSFELKRANKAHFVPFLNGIRPFVKEKTFV